MKDPMEIQEAFKIVVDEIEVFMESMYSEMQGLGNFIQENAPEDFFDDEEFFELKINGALEKLDHMKTVLKIIALQNHGVELFTEQEKEELQELQSLLEAISKGDD